MLNLEHIASFLAVLRTRNFRAAAHERALSQATVTQHIQKLEAALNTRLIARSHSGCTPTPAGTALSPHAERQMADISIYRWEYNFRASTVMGMVGAGGIGFELMGSLRIMQYQDVSAILLVILVMVTLVDGFSSTLRKRFK